MVPTISALKLFSSGDVMQALFGKVNREVKEKNALKGGAEKSNNAGRVSLQSGSKHVSETLQNTQTLNFSGAKKLLKEKVQELWSKRFSPSCSVETSLQKRKVYLLY